MTFVQVIICIVSVCVYGFAPFGIAQTQVSMEVATAVIVSLSDLNVSLKVFSLSRVMYVLPLLLTSCRPPLPLGWTPLRAGLPSLT